MVVVYLGSTAVQAAAHGVVAACAGLLGQALVGRQLASANGFVDPLLSPYRPLLLCFLGLLAAVVKTGAGAISVYGQKRTAFQVGDAIRQEVTDAILRCGQPPGAASRTHAALAVRLREVERGVDEGLLAGARAAANLLPLGAVLVALSTPLALAALGVLAPFAVGLSWVRRRFRAGNERSMALAEDLHAGVDELVRHLDLWRTYGAAGRVRAALAAAGEAAGRAGARADACRSALSGANEALAALALVAVVALVEAGHLALGAGPLVAFAAVFFLMYRPLRDLGDARTAADRGAHALGELDRMRAALAEAARTPETEATPTAGTGARTSFPAPPEPAGSPVHAVPCDPRTPSPWGTEALEVEGLLVGREGHRTQPTSFRAAPGEVIGIVGPTGAGKTSLLRALLGLEPGARGRVRYGRHDLARAGVGPLARPFAWVPQEPAIVAGTLEENVRLGAPDLSEADAHEALARVGAGRLADRRRGERLLPGGHELSGGERQWVALARALASGQPVLLLDEPTAGLDAASQALVLEALGALRGQRTVIVVSHRPEPLALADRIVALGNAV